MQTVLYLEINIIGIALLLIIFFSYRSADIKPTEQKLFDQLLLVMMLVLTTDSIGWCVNGMAFPGARMINIVCNVLYFLLSPLMCYFWYVYVRYRVGRPISPNSVEGHLYMLPTGINIACSILTAFTGWFFYFDDANRYQRGPAFFVYAVIGFTLLALSVLAALRKARHTERALRRPYLLLAVFTLVPIVGTLLQTIFPWCYTTLISTVLAVLVFYIGTLNQQIHTDSLTQLNNRRRLNEFLVHRAAALPEDARLYAIMLDVDDFKRINDTYGHAVGDEALQAASTLLKNVCADSSSFLARIGGDEFVILTQCALGSTPELILDDVQSAFADYTRRNEGGYALSVSAGYAFTDATHPKSPERLLAEADEAMYRAKGTAVTSR